MSRVIGKDGQYLPLPGEDVLQDIEDCSLNSLKPKMSEKAFSNMNKVYKKRGPKTKPRYCKKLLPVGYRGQKYIVTCKDEEGKDMTVGWTDNQSGKPFVNSVNKHPSWNNSRIERMPEHMITSKLERRNSMMRAKMIISRIEEDIENGKYEVLHMSAVGKNDPYDKNGSDENNTYAQYTPSASLTIDIRNPDLLGKFKRGEVYYLDFTKADR